MPNDGFHSSVPNMTRPPGTPEDAWDLFCAAAAGHLPNIRELVRLNRELIHYQIWYEFPIHYAVRGGHVEAVRCLLDAGTNPAWSYYRYSSWQKLLPMAEQRELTDVHDVLVAEMKCRFNYDPRYKPLFAAIAEKGDSQEVIRTIDDDPTLVHVADEHGNRPLHWAVLARQLTIIEALLDAGADIGAQRADLQTPLHLSVVGDYWFRKSDKPKPDTSAQAVTDLLLRRGADYEFSVAVARGDRQRIDQVLAKTPQAATRLNASRRSPLGLAAGHGHIEIVRLLLEHRADPNLAEECCARGAALFEACGRNDVPTVELLLEHGADPNAECDSSGSCLSIAEHCGNEPTSEVVRLLRNHGAKDPLWRLDTPEQINERLRGDESLSHDDSVWSGILQRVIATENVATLRQFVDRFGFEPIRNMDPANGWNLVSTPEFLDELMRLGMDINRPDWLGQSYLHVCADDEDPKRAGLCVAKGINLDAVDFANGTTALGVAAMKGNTTMVKFLLDHGADPSLPEEHPWAQPRLLAEREKKWDTELAIRTHILLRKLATDPRSVLEPNSNLLHSAAHYSEEEIVWALLEAGADIEAEHPHAGGKPLHWATEGNVKICGWLIERGADVNSRVVSDNERNGMTPLIYCAWWCGDCEECIKIAEFLIDSGADMTARDAEGKSAVERARQQGHDNLAKALAARGCE